MTASKTAKTAILGVAGALLLSGCVGRLSDVGKAPELSEVKREDLPGAARPSAARRDPTASLPPEVTRESGQSASRQSASLWGGSRESLFADQSANEIGDILTVEIDIEDEAEFSNETSRSREASEDMGVDALLGYATSGTLAEVLPEAIDPAQAAALESQSDATGSGSTEREEEIQFQIAAMIVDELPNGNFVVRGRQEIRVNYELRDLQVSGIIRPEDIGRDNSISYDKIAEARISYGGRGRLSEVQQPRYGQQILDIILPF